MSTRYNRWSGPCPVLGLWVHPREGLRTFGGTGIHRGFTGDTKPGLGGIGKITWTLNGPISDRGARPSIPVEPSRFWMGHTHRISSAAVSPRLHALHAGAPVICLEGRSTKFGPGIPEEECRLEPNRGDTDEDAQRLKDAMVHLQESGWYWGAMTAAEATLVLGGAAVGAFLVRDSSNPGHLLTLSVKTSLGPTHLRLEYAAGHFALAAAAGARPRLRRFRGVLELVQHYHARAGRRGPDPPALQLQLRQPRHRTPRGLQHLCRLVVNRHSRDHHQLPLPTRLRDFLWEYPFIL